MGVALIRKQQESEILTKDAKNRKTLRTKAQVRINQLTRPVFKFKMLN